ncbi:hypothetical protein, no similarity [Maudiozyma saulgeensis]|uniref:C2H2-type domain-containing protein n=1 Tax=Maudiozyma saulgeensis TaxID=1789683 RepID=A0A1X7R738_9SACH|nr:hypothetical protein, no similarity [Kazachstania saulgeensis]
MTFQFEQFSFVLQNEADDPFLLPSNLPIEDPLGPFTYFYQNIESNNFRPIIRPLEHYNIPVNVLFNDTIPPNNSNIHRANLKSIQAVQILPLSGLIEPTDIEAASESSPEELVDNVDKVEHTVHFTSATDLAMNNSEETPSQTETTSVGYRLNMVNNRGEKDGAKQKKTHQCIDCLRMCQSDSHLDRHVETVHSEERPWACPACLKKRFKRKDHLVKHLKTLHHWSSHQMLGLKTPQAVLDRKKKRKKASKNPKVMALQSQSATLGEE